MATSDAKLIASECSQCRDKERLLRHYYENALLTVEDPATIIIPEYIKCSWCRRDAFVRDTTITLLK